MSLAVTWSLLNLPETESIQISRQPSITFLDKEGRWLVIDPVFAELLKDEDSRIMNGDFVSSKDELKNGMIFGNLHGFKVYMSNNLPAKMYKAGERTERTLRFIYDSDGCINWVDYG